MKRLIIFLVLLTGLLILTGTALTEIIPVDEAHFPDTALREYVRDRLDEDGDGSLSDEERNNVTVIVVSERGIKSLKGVELFPNLETFYCDNNDIPSLLGLNLPYLVGLDCSYNSLGTLNLGAFPELENVRCIECGLTELNVSGNKHIQDLNCTFCFKRQFKGFPAKGKPLLYL